MTKTGYNIAAIRMWLEVDGSIVDISSAQFTFALNSIPQASLVLAAGVQAKTAQLSNAIELAEDMGGFPKAKLYLQGQHGTASERNTVTVNGRYLLFEGYLTGLNAAVGGGLRLQATLTHWLSDLNYSSAVSANSSPENPWQFSFNAAIHTASGGTAAATPTGHFLPITEAQSILTSENIQADLWGQGILPWFKELASQDRINLPEFGKNDTPTKAVQAALKRFTGDRLPLQVNGVDYIDAARAICEDITCTTLDPNNSTNHMLGMANVTLWDKLVGELAGTYRFAVVPFPTEAKVVPFVAGLRSTWRDMLNRDEASVDINSQLIRPLGGLGIYGAFDSATGGFIPPSTPPDMHIGGKFMTGTDGMIMLKRAPRWLNTIVLPGALAVGPVGGAPVADAMAPAAGAAGAAPAVKAKQLKNLFDKMAQSLFIDEVLRHRSGQLLGPLRFDICPGSSISFQGHNGGSKRGIRYGSVLAVSYSIDAEQQQASTGFVVGHIRTPKENQSDNFSLAQHPIYNRVWKGDKLVNSA